MPYGLKHPGGEYPSDKDPILDALSDAILKSLSGLQPQAPTPPSFQGFSPLTAAAAAMNPQQIPLLAQKEMGPAQAQYSQQQAAFEQAMQGRREAMGAGVALTGQANRADIAALQGEQKQSQNDIMNALRQQGLDLREQQIQSQKDMLRFLPTTGGYLGVTRTGEEKGYVRSPSGGPAMPIPPAGIVSDIAAGTATLQGLDSLRQAYKDIRAKTQGQGTVEKIAKGAVGATRYGGAFESTRDYAEYKSSVRQALNAYIKSVTGAQFSVAELQRYEAQFPEPWDDESLAESKIQNLSQRAIADMKAKMRAFPAATGAAPVGTHPADLDSEFDAYMKNRGRNAPNP